MPFGRYLNNIMIKKDITAKELSNKMKAIGESMDDSYISKILKGECVPKDKKIKAISKVLDCDYEALRIEKYCDIAPEPIKDVFEVICINGLKSINKNWNSIMGRNGRKKFPALTKKEIISQLNNMPRCELISLISKSMKEDDKFANIYEKVVLNGKTLSIDSQTTLGLPIQDRAMEPMGIKKNCTAMVQLKEEYEDNDIILILKKKEGIMVARMIKYIGRNIYLIALQEEKNELYNETKHTILGKIVQVNTFL